MALTDFETHLQTLAGLLGENRWLIEVFAVVFASLLASFVVARVLQLLERQAVRSRNYWDDALLLAARPSLSWFILTIGMLWALGVVLRVSESENIRFLGPARELTVIFFVAMFAVRFIRIVERSLVSESVPGENRLDETTAAALGRLLRVAVVITGVLAGLQTVGISVSGALAFGGIGGIAVGFAARDLLANFFGGLMIYLDRPFSVGDWIRSPDREIEGTVEEVGWRQTRIRTFDQRPLYVPNSVFMTLTVENPSRMLNRRIRESIGIAYADVAALPNLLAAIRLYLHSHPDIAPDRTLMVHFDRFGASSLDCFVYTFTRTTSWTEYHRIKERILLGIARIIEVHGARIAFPTRTVNVNLPEPSNVPSRPPRSGPRLEGPDDR